MTRPSWWQTALVKDQPGERAPDEILPWRKTTLMRDHLGERPPDERPPWWKTTLMTDHTHDRSPWWGTTLVKDHPDRDHPDERPPDERPPWWQTIPRFIHYFWNLVLHIFMWMNPWPRATSLLRLVLLDLGDGLKRGDPLCNRFTVNCKRRQYTRQEDQGHGTGWVPAAFCHLCATPSGGGKNRWQTHRTRNGQFSGSNSGSGSNAYPSPRQCLTVCTLSSISFSQHNPKQTLGLRVGSLSWKTPGRRFKGRSVSIPWRHTRNFRFCGSKMMWLRWLFLRVRRFWENVRQFIPRLRFFFFLSGE